MDVKSFSLSHDDHDWLDDIWVSPWELTVGNYSHKSTIATVVMQ